MILTSEGNIDSISLPEEIRESRNAAIADPPPNDSDPGGDFLVSLRELEEDYIRKVLAATGNNKTQAAKILGIHPTSLLRRLKKEPVLSWILSASGFQSHFPHKGQKNIGFVTQPAVFWPTSNAGLVWGSPDHIWGQLKAQS